MAKNRIEELEEWSEETGLPLPMSAEEIVYLEDQGHIVDLETGEVFDDPEDGEDTLDEELEIWAYEKTSGHCCVVDIFANAFFVA